MKPFHLMTIEYNIGNLEQNKVEFERAPFSFYTSTEMRSQEGEKKKKRERRKLRKREKERDE